MADGAKILTGYNDWFPIPYIAPDTAADGFDWTLGLRGLYDPGTPQKLKVGSWTINLPTSIIPYAPATAGKVKTYFDDFYNRIYLEPVLIDFGAITSDASVVTKIWNAFYNRTVTLASVNFDSSAGLRIEGNSVPKVIGKLQELNYNVVATADGVAIMDTPISWVFDLPLTFVQQVKGSRVRLVGLPPAWPPSGQSYKINYAFQTTMTVSRSGKEQRIANRRTARKTLNFQSFVNNDTFRAFKDNMWYWQHRAFAIPELPRRATSSLAMATGENTMTFSSVPNWLVAGTQVILSTKTLEDIRVVQSVAGNVVTYKTQSAQNWPAGTRVYPGLTGNMDTTITAGRRTNAVAIVGVEFVVTPLSEPYIAPPAAPSTFNGRELFLTKPNWLNAVDGTFAHDVDILDYGRGPITRFTPVKFGSDTRRATYLAKNFAEAELLREFFFRMKGRQGEFYMPTWEYDFKPKILAPAGTSSFRVAGTDFAAFYKDSTVQKAMFVQMRSGTVQLRKVLSIQAVTDGAGSDSLITIDTPWTEAVSQDTVTMAGWMPAWRLASDELTIEWLTSSVANVQLTMVTLEDLPVETP